DEPEGPERNSWWRLIMLGVGGGIVPCWDAALILYFCWRVERLWMAFPLLLAFSAGLSGVLVAVGIAVVKARNFLLSRQAPQATGPGGENVELPDDVSLGRWELTLNRLGHVLPIISALVIICIGTWMCFAGASMVR